MPRRNTVHTFAISTEAAERQFAGLVDMLRYDAARVIEHDAALIILQTERTLTEARWASFGIHVLAHAVSQTGWEPIPWIREQALPKLPLTTTR